MNQYYVYIITNQKYGTLYIGVTNDIIRRIWDHKQKTIKGFSEKYNLDKLVYYETTESIETAITREKQLKNWQRQWKIEMIDKFNPEWTDLYSTLLP
jgi:putative endonuclease